MSSALFEVNVYSSPLIVAKVKLCPWSFPPLANQNKRKRHKHGSDELVADSTTLLDPVWAFTDRLLDTAVISGKESSRRTCSCSSTK